MGPSGILKSIAFAVINMFALLLVGPPGVGKTQMVIQVVCELLGLKLIIFHPVTSDPTDFKGLPAVKDGRAMFLPYSELNKIIEITELCVVFFDDLGQATGSVQASVMQLVEGKRIGEHKISDTITFIAATNRKGDKAHVKAILEPLKNRFHTILHITVDDEYVEEWIRHSIKCDMPTDIVAFIATNKDQLSAFVPTNDMTNSPSPRGWFKVGDILNGNRKTFAITHFKNSSEEIKKLIRQAVSGMANNPEYESIKEDWIAGAVGSGAAKSFTAFCALRNNLPSRREIISNPHATPVPRSTEIDGIGKLYAISSMLAGACSPIVVKNSLSEFTYDEVAEAIFVYTSRFDKKEFQTFIIADAGERFPQFKNTPAFIKWGAKSGNKLLAS